MSVIIIRTLCFAIIAVQGSVNGRYIGKDYFFNYILDNLTPQNEAFWPSGNFNPESPCIDKSSFVRKDLEAIVDYMYEELKLHESISKAYLPKANEIQKKYINQLETFDEWFKGQPEHLKHIIESLTDRRNFLEPQIKKVGNTLKNYDSLKKHIDRQQHELDTLTLKFKRFKNICHANCPGIVTRLSAQKEHSLYYCGTAAEIKNISTAELMTYVNTILKPDLLKELTSFDAKYEKDIDTLEENIKDIALKDYGRLLVDILRFHDEYNHYYKLFDVDIESYKNEVDEKLLFMDGKLAQLHAATEKYRKYCLQCDENSPILFSWKHITDINERSNSGNLEPQHNLLNDVIKSKIEKIHQQSLSDIENIFSELDVKIDEIKQRNTNVTNFKPIQEDIKKDFRKEKQLFNELKSVVSKESIENFLSLDNEASKLDVSIGDTLGEVKKLIL
ncbi:unnamed protein product [Pieris macdunnoughi]|uniref:Uncharacterized protein n=1 Tax=Pieris macdunnoughi TaxID=345717 RepID=A0A821QB02_9NEOP|nr:unnamed protein product [Pieris macdunnoughi]